MRYWLCPSSEAPILRAGVLASSLSLGTGSIYPSEISRNLRSMAEGTDLYSPNYLEEVFLEVCISSILHIEIASLRRREGTIGGRL